MEGARGKDGCVVDLRRGVLVGNDGTAHAVEDGWLDLSLGGGQLPHGITVKAYGATGRIHVIRGLNCTAASVKAALDLLGDSAFPLTLRTGGKGSEVVRDRAGLGRRLRGAFHFHGTSANRLESIVERGLEPSTESDWRADPEHGDLAEWSLGKVFFAQTAEEARAYADEKAALMGQPSETVVLRVATRDLRGVEWDRMGRGGDVFVAEAVPANALRVERQGAWLRLEDPEVLASLSGGPVSLAPRR